MKPIKVIVAAFNSSAKRFRVNLIRGELFDAVILSIGRVASYFDRIGRILYFPVGLIQVIHYDHGLFFVFGNIFDSAIEKENV